MYRVLLADDEPSILDSLQNNIPWNEYGLEVAWTASTGRQVYDILDKCNPDIAVLDIQMPGYSGLDLSRLISEKNVQTQIIIISGYAEFSYAQKAIHYGVIGYCLKPLEYDEITKFLLRAIHNLNQYAPTLSADRFLEAIEANEQKKIEDYLCKIGFSDNPCFLAASTGEQPLPLTEGQTFSVGRDQFVYLSNVPWKKKAFSDLLRASRNNRSVLTGIGYSPAPVSLSAFRVTFYHCIAMAYNYFIDPQSRLCNEYDECHSLILLSEIRNAAGSGKKETLCQLLLKLLDNNGYRNFSVITAVQLYDTVISSPSLLPDFQDYYIYSYRQLVHEYDSFHDMIDKLVQLIRNTENTAEELPGSASNNHFLKIMQYINTCYSENISLNDVAAVANLAPNYISQIFKKQVGVTFSTYLARLRIEHAKNYLSTTTLSISDIAQKTGFNDYFYFLKTFKKYTGQTPSEYRNETD